MSLILQAIAGYVRLAPPGSRMLPTLSQVTVRVILDRAVALTTETDPLSRSHSVTFEVVFFHVWCQRPGEEER